MTSHPTSWSSSRRSTPQASPARRTRYFTYDVGGGGGGVRGEGVDTEVGGGGFAIILTTNFSPTLTYTGGGGVRNCLRYFTYDVGGGGGVRQEGGGYRGGLQLY